MAWPPTTYRPAFSSFIAILGFHSRGKAEIKMETFFL